MSEDVKGGSNGGGEETRVREEDCVCKFFFTHTVLNLQ